jgi:hypothetical protein
MALLLTAFHLSRVWTLPLAGLGMLLCLLGFLATADDRKPKNALWLALAEGMSLAVLLTVWFWPHWLNPRWRIDFDVPGPDLNHQPDGRSVEKHVAHQAEDRAGPGAGGGPGLLRSRRTAAHGAGRRKGHPPQEGKGKDKKPAALPKKAKKVTFTIGMARLEKVDDANFVITATYLPRLPKASMVSVRREFPKESEKPPNDQATYVAVNRLVNINVREDVKIQDHKGKMLKLRHLRAEMEAQAKDILKRLKRRYPKTDVKFLTKMVPSWLGIGVTLELQADGVGLVVAGI